MAGSFRIAEGYVEVTADETGYARAMERLKSRRPTVSVGVQLDDRDAIARLDRLARDRLATVKLRLDDAALARLRLSDIKVSINPQIADAALRRIQGQLDRVTADRVVRIRADVDTRVGAAEIRNLVQRQRVRIGVDVDTRVAADDIANLTRRRTMNVTANANTAAASARIDALTRDRHMNLDVGVSGTGASSSALSSLTGGSSGSGLSVLSGRIAQIAAAVVGALPTLASLGQSLIQMGPAAALAAPAVLGLASAFAAVKIGMSGISDAFKAAFAPAAAGASAALSATKAVEAAQRSLAKAVQAEKDAEVAASAARVAAARAVGDAQLNLKNTVSSVADANRLAAESVAKAEMDLANAQRAAKQAQLDLTQARKDAAQQLTDLNNSLADAQLAQRQDVLSLADAEKNLAQVKALGTLATQDQIDKAQLQYDQAAQALKEQQIQTQRLQDQTDKANKAGVEGSSTVTAAKQGIASANQSVADKERALNDQQIAATRTQIDGIQKIAAAQRNLSDAQAAQVKAAVDGAKNIAAAQDAVIQAAEALAQAQQSASLKTDKLGQAMARLSPQARAFVSAVIAQGSAWRALKLDVQDRLFQGLGGTFTRLSTAVLPTLHAGLTGTAGILNTMAKNAASAVMNLAKTGQLRTMFDGLNQGLRPLSRIPGQFLTALAQLSIGAAPAFKRLTTAVGNAVDSIMKKLNAGLKSGGLTDAINKAVDVARQFGRLLLDIAGTVGNVLKAAASSGGNALGTLGSVFKELRRITAMPEAQQALAAIFTMTNTVGKLLAGTVGGIFSQLVIALGKIAPAVTNMLNSLGNIAPLLGGILLAVNPVLGVFVLLAPVIGQLVKPIAGIVTALGPVLQTVGSLFALLAPALAVLLPPIQVLMQALGGALKPIVAALGPVVMAAARALGALVTAAAPLLPVIGQMVAALGPVLTPILGIIGSLFTALSPVISQLAKSLLPPFLKITQTLGEVFQKLAPVVGKALEQLGSQGLVPIVAALGVIIGQLVTQYADQFLRMFAQLLPIIPILIPVVVQLAQSIAQILVAIAPLLPQIMLLGVQMLTQLLPAIIPLMQPLADLASAFLWLATGTITDVVMPVLTGLVGFLSGLQSAFQPAINAVTWLTTGIHDAFQWLYDVLIGHSIIPNIVNGAIRWFTGLWAAAKRIFTDLKRDVESIWNGLWSAVRSAWNGFWGGMSGALNSARGWIGNTFNGIRNTVSGIWSGLWNGVSSTFRTIIGAVTRKISDFASGTRTAFGRLRDALGTIWNGVKDKFAAPIRFVVGTVYNNGIRAMWDTIADKVGLPQLPEIRLGFATGGVVPGAGPGDTVPAMLTPGERILSLAQVAKLGGHAAIDAMVGRTDNHGPRFGIGGIIGSIGSAAASAVGSVTDALGSAASWAKNLAVGGLEAAARTAIKAVVQPLINRIPTGGTDLGQMAKAVPATILDSILKTLGAKDKTATAMGGGQIAYTPTAGVAQWTPQILKALLLLQQPPSWLGTVERRMNQESGGNPNVVNKWDCLTLDAMILTQRGWLKHDEVQVGDQTIGYNRQTGESEWTAITRVVHFGDAELVKLSNSRWSATTTPNHRWVNLPVTTASNRPPDADSCPQCVWPEGTRRRGTSTAGGLRIHLAKAHGIKGEKLKAAPATEAQWVTTEEIKAHDRLLLAAPAATPSSLDITVQEAAILGWIAGDGHIEKRCPTPAECKIAGYTPDGVCQQHKARQSPSASISQSKPAMVVKLKELLRDTPHTVYVDEQMTRTGKQAIGPRHVFRLSYEYAQDLMRRAGHPRDNAVDQILSMSTEQRAAWLEALVDAEGHTAKAVGGNKPQVLIYQRPGNVLEAIALAVYLSGARPRIAQSKRNGQPDWSPESLVRMNNPIVTGHSLVTEDAGRGDVWCVTTGLGSWTARQGDHIFLTGNSNWTAGTPSVGLMQVIGPTFGANAGPFAGTGPFSYGVSVDPLANTFAGLRYAIHRYGSLSALNRPGGYDSGGLLMPGATVVANRTGRPERVLTADHTAKLDAMLSREGAGGGITIEAIHINGTFDFSSRASRKQAADAMVVEMKEALRDFDRGRR